jgi:hypothetical protein
LCSHSSRCACKASSLSTCVHPYIWLSHAMLRRLRRFRKILGTERRFAVVMGWRSTGHVGCRLSHSWIHPVQNACSHEITWRGSAIEVKHQRTESLRKNILYSPSSTDEQIGQISSSSTSPLI